MKNPYRRTILIIYLLLSFMIMFGCSSNTLTGDDGTVTGGNSLLSGRIELNDGDTPDGIYVWLEGFNIGTYSDLSGDFELALPKPDSQPGGGLNGVFRLFYFIANCQPETSEVIINNGLYDSSNGDFDENGVLRRPKTLIKLINIDVIARFVPRTETTIAFYSSEMTIEKVTLLPVELALPQSLSEYLAASILRTIQVSGDLYDVYDFSNELAIETITSDLFLPIQIEINEFNRIEGTTFQVIPIFYVLHDQIPDELYNSLDLDFGEVSEDYLNYPIKCHSQEFVAIFFNP